MNKNFTLKKVLTIFAILPAFQLCAQIATTFSYTGASETYTVPAGITNIQIEAWGAQGGGSEICGGTIDEDGGLGGYTVGNLAVTAGEVLYIYVGGKPTTTIGGASPAGFNGGGIAGQYGGSGGGASDVRVGGTDLTDRIIVAGGGGGGNTGCPDHGAGGEGGGTVGGNGLSFEGYDVAFGGSDIAGGSGAGGATDGTLGEGGTGAYHVGGGGGGYYGGGAAYAAGGGGGSSYIGGVTDGNTTGGIRTGHGEIVITELCDPLTVTASASWVCFGESVTIEASGTGDITWDGGLVNGEPFMMDVAGFTTFTATSDSPSDCEFSIEIYVTEEIVIAYATTDEISGADGAIDVTVTGGVPAYVYDWDTDGTGDFDDTEDLTGLVAGTYTIQVMDDSLCVSSQDIVVNSQLGVQHQKVQLLEIYPNPTNGLIYVSYPGNFRFELCDINGKVIVNGQGNNQQLIDLKEQADGIYFVRISSKDKVETIKVVKK